MACLGEELNLLHSLIMAYPCVYPFFRYKASMLFLPQIGGWLCEAFSLSVSMEHSGGLVDLFTGSFFFVFLLMLL